MKTKLLIWCMILTLGLWSCKKDDDSSSNDEEYVVDNSNTQNTDNTNNNGSNSENQSTNEQPVSESAEDNLPEQTRAFVGCWRSTKTYRDGSYPYMTFITFFSAGTCVLQNLQTYSDTYDSYAAIGLGESEKSGYWTYDENTRILATTVGYQWNITLSNSETWAGLILDGEHEENTTFEKFDKGLLYRFMHTHQSWKCTKNITYHAGVDKDTTVTYNFYYNTSPFTSIYYHSLSYFERKFYPSTGDVSTVETEYLKFTYGDNIEIKNNTLTINYTYERYSRSGSYPYNYYQEGVGESTLTIKNFYSDNPTLLLGIEQENYYRSADDEYMLSSSK